MVPDPQVVDRNGDGSLVGYKDGVLYRGVQVRIGFDVLVCDVVVAADGETVTRTLRHGDYVHGEGTYTRAAVIADMREAYAKVQISEVSGYADAPITDDKVQTYLDAGYTVERDADGKPYLPNQPVHASRPITDAELTALAEAHWTELLIPNSPQKIMVDALAADGSLTKVERTIPLVEWTVA